MSLDTARDFNQLRPCFENFIFEAPQLVPDRNKQGEHHDLENRISRARTVSAEQITGFHLWRTFEIVVKLAKNMRHAKDPAYGSLFSRLRLDNQTWNDFETLNT